MSDQDHSLEQSSLPFSPEDLQRMADLKKAVRAGQRSDFPVSSEARVQLDELKNLHKVSHSELTQLTNLAASKAERNLHRPTRHQQHKRHLETQFNLKSPEQALMADFTRTRDLLEQKLQSDSQAQRLVSEHIDVPDQYYRKVNVGDGNLVVATQNGIVDMTYQKAGMDLNRIHSREDITLHIEPSGQFYYARETTDYENGQKIDREFYLINGEQKIGPGLLDEIAMLRPIIHAYLQD